MLALTAIRLSPDSPRIDRSPEQVDDLQYCHRASLAAASWHQTKPPETPGRVRSGSRSVATHDDCKGNLYGDPIPLRYSTFMSIFDVSSDRQPLAERDRPWRSRATHPSARPTDDQSKFADRADRSV
jgi:hypothetical protein